MRSVRQGYTHACLCCARDVIPVAVYCSGLFLRNRTMPIRPKAIRGV